MELSELVQFHGRLLGMCDRTGILYKIDLSAGHAFPRWAIADGDGEDEYYYDEYGEEGYEEYELSDDEYDADSYDDYSDEYDAVDEEEPRRRSVRPPQNE